ncbi:WD40 domain protein beta Propeller [Streptantibioticus cattleyicolor NRRL 8057 = DSM 46488]|uniref:WD40 domain protein beta Propeller n=1 Tax=Streptantibioticus cattleyicolor (strain ATCC 35852 / DSM 46488 / JCM 4925 / NBRC 14057 / NRRL 8057) TaxID=1003195 RepID=G8X017_STREN|nr:WD40 domain protein beta Propeller [Streptantibioticus cattleyicolor NRRL 8057 = DSM 46488]
MGAQLNILRRRGLAALTTAVALTAGTTALAVPAASAASTPSDGLIAMDNGNGILTVQPDGGGLRSLGGGLRQPAWSPDGSRLVSDDVTGLSTQRYDGTGSYALPSATGAFQDPAYWYAAQDVVFSSAGRLMAQRSDGTTTAWQVLSAAHEPSGVCDDHPAAEYRHGYLYFARHTGRSGNGCAGASAIWKYDPATRAVTKVADNADQPAVSSDGGKLAFVRTVAGHRQVFTARADGSGARRLTTGDTDHTDPDWAPTGTRLVMEATSATTHDVVITDAAGTTTTTVYGNGYHPKWQPLRTDHVMRVWGNNASATAIAGSRFNWAGPPSATPRRVCCRPRRRC